jgi:hypothetical protein
MRPYCLVVAILVVACTSSPVPSSYAKPIPESRIRAPEYTRAQEGFALVVVTRDKGLEVLACTAHLHVDGTLVADLRPREQIGSFSRKVNTFWASARLAASVGQTRFRSTSHGQSRSC